MKGTVDGRQPWKRWLWASLLVLFVGAFASPVLAQGKKKSPPKDIFQLEDTKVGKIEVDTPSVDLILSFKGVHYSEAGAPKSFVPQMVETVEQAPF